MRKQVPGVVTVTITIPSKDPARSGHSLRRNKNTDRWPVAGGREGNPIDIRPNPLPPLAFSTGRGRVHHYGELHQTRGFTHGFSYTRRPDLPRRR